MVLAGVFLCGYARGVSCLRFDTIGRLVGCERTDAGFYRIRARLTRVGVLPYLTAAGVQRELRHPDDVFAPDSLRTAGSGLPVTVGHLGLITTANVGAKVGQTRTDVEIEDETYLTAELQIEDAGTIARIDRGELVEISAGYRADTIQESGTWNGERYDARHKNIRYNHLALLPSGAGRAGSDVGLKFDSADNVGYSTSMDLVEITIGDKVFQVPAEVAAELARLSGMAQGQAEGEQAAQEILTVVVEEPAEEKADALEAAVVERLSLFARMGAGFKYDGQSAIELKRMILSERGVKCDGKDESWVNTALEVLPQVSEPKPAPEPAPEPSALKIDSKEPAKEPVKTPEQIRAERDARRDSMWKR